MVLWKERLGRDTGAATRGEGVGLLLSSSSSRTSLSSQACWCLIADRLSGERCLPPWSVVISGSSEPPLDRRGRVRSNLTRRFTFLPSARRAYHVRFPRALILSSRKTGLPGLSARSPLGSIARRSRSGRLTVRHGEPVSTYEYPVRMCIVTCTHTCRCTIAHQHRCTCTCTDATYTHILSIMGDRRTRHASSLSSVSLSLYLILSYLISLRRASCRCLSSPGTISKTTKSCMHGTKYSQLPCK